MLARCALDLYWMARYLARAQHLCRLLQLQIESLADRSVREIHYGWARIYLCLGRMPPVGGLEFDSDDDFTLADSYTLAGDLTFEQLNPASVWSCLQCARENARQTRNYISGEMWQCINEAFLPEVPGRFSPSSGANPLTLQCLAGFLCLQVPCFVPM